MTFSRYEERSEMLKESEDSSSRTIRHFSTPKFRHATEKEKQNISQFSYIWKLGDRFYKLAYDTYGDSKYWWIIAIFNSTPTESHISAGDIISIPLSIDEVMELYGV